jgi:uncharacterized protein (TIGR02284 family)
MLAVHVHKAPVVVLEKLSHLFDCLHTMRSRFENYANGVADKMMQRTLRSVAQESCQYANELSGQIQSMGGDPAKYFNTSDCSITNGQEAPSRIVPIVNDEVIKQCSEQEVEMIKAYREVLNDSNLYNDLRNMVRYQLNGITCGFLQIKLLTN